MSRIWRERLANALACPWQGATTAMSIIKRSCTRSPPSTSCRWGLRPPTARQHTHGVACCTCSQTVRFRAPRRVPPRAHATRHVTRTCHVRSVLTSHYLHTPSLPPQELATNVHAYEPSYSASLEAIHSLSQDVVWMHNSAGRRLSHPSKLATAIDAAVSMAPPERSLVTTPYP